jgi:hypothetical protein
MHASIRYLAAACGLVLLAACSDVAGPGELTTEEASFLADEFASSSLATLGTGMGAMPGGAPPALEAGPPITWNRTWEATRNCPAGGTVTMAGSVNGEIDRDTRSGTLAVTHSMDMDDCARTRGDVTITVTTDPVITMTGSVSFQAGQRASGSFTKTGTFLWTTSDGRSGSCEVNLSITWGADGGHSITGTMCAREINRHT